FSWLESPQQRPGHPLPSKPDTTAGPGARTERNKAASPRTAATAATAGSAADQEPLAPHRYSRVPLMPMATTMPSAATMPPGVRLPRALSIPAFVFFREPAMRAMRRRYGDAFRIDLPIFGRTTVVSRPDLVKEVFRAPADVLAFGNRSPLGRVLGPGSLF